MVPCDRSQCPAQLPASPNFQNGDSRDNQKLGHKRQMAHFDRNGRCIFPCIDTQKFLTSMFLCGQLILSIKSTAIRVSNHSPRVHTSFKGCKVHSSFRISVHQYLNDWLLRVNTRHPCQLQAKELVQTIHQLCFAIDLEKSEPKPTQEINFLGYHFNMVHG